VVLDRSWDEDSSRAVEEMLRAAGLLASSPEEATHVVDIVVRRNHLSVPGHGIGAEVFLEFVLRRGEDELGSVLTCGVAQRSPFRYSRKVLAATYQEAFDEALHHLFESYTLAELLGEGWRAGSERPGSQGEGPKVASGAAKTEPASEFKRAEEARAVKALQSREFSRLVLEEFTIDDAKYLEQEDAAPDALGRYLPRLVQEHLDAFHPGALEASLSDGEAPAEGDLVLTGQILRYKKGNLWKKAMIGYGAGKDKLDVAVQLRDGGSGETLLELHRVSSDWGGYGRSQQPPGKPGVSASLSFSGPRGGPVAEMADQLGRDLASFLVRHLADGYEYPEGLEVVADWVDRRGP
jgi:hypothetical protein